MTKSMSARDDLARVSEVAVTAQSLELLYATCAMIEGEDTLTDFINEGSL